MAKKTSKEKSPKKRLVLLDAHAILHRAYHALPDFSSSRGEPTGALYGLSLMLLKIITELKPDYITACFDVGKPTYRHVAYENYKAGRKKADDDLIAQIERSKDVFKAFDIPVYEKAGFEADDLLATIVELLKNKNDIEIIIASGDMDTLQLVTGKKVQVYTLKTGIKDTVLYDEDAVKKRFSFGPELLPDYKGFRGDPSDNIPGISGIGEKTATLLLQKFGTIENLYKALEKDEGVLKKEGFKPKAIETIKDNEDEATFSKMLATVKRDVPIDFKLPSKKWSEAFKKKNVLDLFLELDFRTLGDRLKTIFSEEQEESEEGLFAKKDHSEKEEKELLLALWLLDSNVSSPNLEDAFRYTRKDSFNEAKNVVFKKLEDSGLKNLYEEIEKPLIPIVEKMQERGVKIDSTYLKKLSKEYHSELSKLEKKIWKMVGMEFNINSPKQLSEVLFESLNLRAGRLKKTPTGARSTKESELDKIREEHPIIPLILQYRELQKLLSTYIDNLPKMLSSDEKLHAKFNQAGTTTGRMSSEDPNLQNIPIKTELGKRTRNAFTASSGFSLAAFDYSQIELRVAAFMSGDKKLVNVFKNNGDVHTAVASEIFGVSEEKVDYEMRRQAKVINFGILYGMGVNALKANLGTSREEAQKFLNDYFKKFYGLARFLDLIKKDVEGIGFTETLFGRRRYFPAVSSHIGYIKSAAQRMAINAPIQGTSADIIKLAMVKIDEYIQEKGWQDKVFLILQIHDELVYEVKTSLVKEVVPEIKKIMESIVDLKRTQSVPLLVSTEVGKNWGEMKEFKIK